MPTHPMFEQIQGEIPGYAAAAIGNLKTGRFVSHGLPGFDLLPLREVLLGQLSASDSLYEGLGGTIDFGSNDEVLLAASKGYLLARIQHDRKSFVVVQLKASGNLGYLRFKMRDYLRMVD